MKTYEDDYICFDIPEGYKDCKFSDGSWILKKKQRSIWAYSRAPEDCWISYKQFKEQIKRNLPDSQWELDYREPLLHNDNEILITEYITKSPPYLLRRKSIRAYILNNLIGGLCVEINHFDGVFESEIYFPFLKSIKIKKNWEQPSITDVELLEMNTVRFNLPKGFELKEDKEQSRFELIGSGITIEIFDLSGLGREADIELFKERRKEGNVGNHETLIKVGRKEALLNNENGELNLAQCQKINLLLAPKDRCFAVHFDSEKPFDLKTYMSFLTSLGKRTSTPHIWEQ